MLLNVMFSDADMASLFRSGQMQGVQGTGRGGFQTRPYDSYLSTGSVAATPL